MMWDRRSLIDVFQAFRHQKVSMKCLDGRLGPVQSVTFAKAGSLQGLALKQAVEVDSARQQLQPQFRPAFEYLCSSALFQVLTALTYAGCLHS
jgi:hypothetical protein